MDIFRGVQLSGSSRLCCVNGFAGAGKSTLIHEALSQMKQDGSLTVSATLSQFHEEGPYWAIVFSLCGWDAKFPGPVYLAYHATIIS
jgi:predicted ATPase